jgi:hypothetical protein
MRDKPNTLPVIPGLVPGIHVFSLLRLLKTWMAGTSPAMTLAGFVTQRETWMGGIDRRITSRL